jgi:nucleotide-binding universal stress UspA family protein
LTWEVEMEKLIVVGVDGSEPSKAALEWAVEEARLRGASLRVVYAWNEYPMVIPGGPVLPYDPEELKRSAHDFVERLVEETLGTPQDVEITTVALLGPAAGVLVDAAVGAEMLVVGSRGHGGFAGLLLGSVSQQCVHHAPCPVVIVRGTEIETTAAEPHESAVADPVV